MTAPFEASGSATLAATASENEAWAKSVVEGFNSPVDGGSIGGASDGSVCHS